MKKKHLIIGSSAAGMGVCTKLRALAPDDDITCLTASAEMPYNTCLLADYLADGKHPKGIWTKPQSFFGTKNITLQRSTRVMEIDHRNQRVRDQHGNSHAYDTLFLGLGTQPITLPTERPIVDPQQAGMAGRRLFTFHTLSDTTALDDLLRNTQQLKTALVIGAGLSGVECADALVERGLQVTLIEGSTHLLPTLVNAQGSAAIELLLKKYGVTFIPKQRVAHIMVNTDGAACGAALSDGTQLHADLVVQAIGARANTSLVEAVGGEIACDGVLVNEFFQTSIDNIYAGGDVATMTSVLDDQLQRSGTWPDAMQHGMLAGRAISGDTSKPYPGLAVILSSKFFGTQFVSCGPVVNTPPSYKVIERGESDWYHKFVLDGDVLKGFLMVGTLDNIGALRRAVVTKGPIDENTL
ncbi:MAG: FAD-dependent oxidoreductase [Candidatus Dependentiae bacterium]|jgi:NAD(P)H-nitrite reductase large subunit